MADVIGLVARLIGIIQLVGQVVILTHGYIGGVKRASQDISSLVDELGSLSKVLSALKEYIETKPKSSALLKLNGLDGPLRGCAGELEALQAKLAPRDGLKGILDSIKWPLKEAETQAYVTKFERHKTLFTLALTVDHITLSKEIESYVRTTAVLTQDIWADSADQKAWRLKYDLTALAEKRDRVLGWISPKDFEKRTEDKHLETSKLRHKNTGNWLLVAPELRDLAKKNTNSSLLWGFGIPGAGKTFLSSVVVDHYLEEAATKNYGVAYMYFEYKERELQTPTNTLASLVRQLAAQTPNLPTEIEALHDKLEAKGKRPKFEELYAALIVTFKSFDQVFLIFDALDECDPKNQRKELLPLFHRLKKSGASLFVTSRQYPEDIQESFRDSAKIELSPKGEDIGVYIQQRINEDARARRLVRQAKCEDRVVSELVDGSQGMFLLARFNIEYVCQQPTAKKVLSALDKIKSSSTTDRPLDPTYDRAMETLQDQSEDCVNMGLLALTWLVKANRTLTVEEVRVAIVIEPNRYELDELDLPDMTTILDICAGLVIIDETSNTMKLAHYTVQEYLLNKSVIPEDASFKLAMACTTFLSFDIFAEGACTSDASLKDRLKSQPFLRYAVHQLLDHLKACDEDLTTDMVLKFLGNPGNVVSYVQVLYYGENVGEDETESEEDGESDDEDDESSSESSDSSDDEEEEEEGEGEEETTFDSYPKEHSAMHVASTLGHRAVLEILMAQGVDISIPDSFGSTLLHLAACGGHDEVVELLLENGFDCSALDTNGETPLHCAAWAGYDSIVRLILKQGVDLSIQATDGSTALFQAAMAGKLEAVRLLLENGADTSIIDADGETPLHISASEGHREVFRLLLEHGANFSVLDNEGETALHGAAWNGDEESVKLLLAKGANIAVRDKRGISAVGNAVSTGHIAVVRLLLDKGADISAREVGGETLLHIAAAEGHTDISFLLLERGVDFFVQNNGGETALHEAAWKGDERLVELLVEKGADISARDNSKNTPLRNASYAGRVAIVRFLLEAGASVSDADVQGLQPLHCAAYRGHLELIPMLLDKGADISTPDGDGALPLHLAAGAGHEEVARLLIERGASCSVRDNSGEGPLHMAIRKGRTPVVHLLLESGVDVNARDNDGESALHTASRRDDQKAVELLLQNGADISLLDNGGKSVLNRTAKEGYLTAVQLLIEKGANISNQNKRGRTPLHHAAKSGHEAVVQLLLDKGADISIKDTQEETALAMAVAGGHSGVVTLLEVAALKRVKIA